MFGRFPRFSSALFASAAIVIPYQVAHAAEQQHEFSIPAQPASESIPKFAKQAGIQILVVASLTDGVRTNAVVGTYDSRQALDMLLEGTGLQVSSWEGSVVRLGKDSRAVTGGSAIDNARSGDFEPIVVTGVTGPFRAKNNSTAIVETAVYDDIETMASDGTIASMLVQLPGISTEEDADQPRYITIRGISADLNHTTIDGITVATVGENGGGTRRTNLQLIPSDLSSRSDVTKTFSAEQDAGAIGGAINIVTRSAFDPHQRPFLIDVYGIYHTFKGEKGSNAGGDSRRHWGGGVKANFSHLFGPDEQFGVVLSGRYEDRVRNAAKRWQDNKRFFDAEGNNIPQPDHALGWNGWASPGNHGYGSYTNILKSYGGSAKLEWRPTDDSLYASLLGYSYTRRESSTMNSNYVDAAAWVENQTEEGGRQRITNLVENWRYNQWNRNNRGLLSTVSWTSGESELTFRGGITQERYRDWEPYLGARAQPTNEYMWYSSKGLPQLEEIENPAIMHGSEYRLVTQREGWHYARQRLYDGRLDFSHNVGRGAEGLGFVAGVEWRRLNLKKDVERRDYSPSGRVNEYLFDSGFKPVGSNYSFPWFDYHRFRAERWDSTPLNETASAYNSGSGDYRYKEDTAAAYLSVHYRFGDTTIIPGVRYDDVKFDAFTPVIEDGKLTGEIANNEGGYNHFLPSLNVVHRFGSNTNLRFSYSKTLGRPTPGNIATAQSISCGDDEEGGVACTITRGNPDLKPRRSQNYDATVEHYFAGSNGMVLLGYFRKDIKDDIFTLRNETLVDGETYLIRQPVNASDSRIQGAEFAVVYRNIPLGEHRLDASFNAARMWGKMKYVSDSMSRDLDRLISQPDWIGNLSLTYRVPELEAAARVNVNYRSKFLSSIGANPWLDRANDELMTVNLAAWHKVTQNITFKYEWNNVFDAQPKYLMGEKDQWVRQIDEYGTQLFFHVIAEF